MTCPWCKVTFTGQAGRVFCSETCQRKDANQRKCQQRRDRRQAERIANGTEMKTCPECEMRFLPDRTKPGRQIYCSPACTTAHHGRIRNAERLKARRELRTRPRACGWCKKTFTPKPTGGKTPTYCSATCRHAKNHQARIERYQPEKRARIAQIRERARPTGLPVTARVCTNCTHWGAKGCALELFRPCNPGTMSRHWEAKKEATA